MTEITLRVNGQIQKVAVDDPNMPLLYALRGDLGLLGPKFGCGLGQCGACCIIIDGEAVRSCVTLAIDAHDKEIKTLEGWAIWIARAECRKRSSRSKRLNAGIARTA
jgi:nicotinate dehydrogenase subunit A